MSARNFKPSHRNPKLPQPEICEVTGIMVAAEDLVISDVEGLRGAAVCGARRWLRRARFMPSYNDLRRLHPAPHLAAEQELETSGDALWFRISDDENDPSLKGPPPPPDEE